METEETPSTQESPQMGWLHFHGKPVMLQLSQAYIGCTYAYSPTIDKETGGALAVPVLSGQLSVEPDGCGGVMLVLRMMTGNGNDYAIVAVKPQDVVFATHIHEARIVTQ